MSNSKPGWHGPPGSRMVGRPKGALNKSTRLIQMEALRRAGEVVNRLVDMATQDYRRIVDRDGNEEAVEKVPCETCGRGMPHNPCPFCKREMPRDESIILNAINSYLDRWGFAKLSKLEITNVADTAWIEYLSNEELEQLSLMIDKARGRMPVNEGPQDGVTM